MSSTSDFINAKIASVSAYLEFDEKYRDALKEVLPEFEVFRKERELLALKRQKKTVVDDMDEILRQRSTMDEAYAILLMENPSIASGRWTKQMFNQGAWAKQVTSYYGAQQSEPSGSVQRYCHVTGWWHASEIKCTHYRP